MPPTEDPGDVGSEISKLLDEDREVCGGDDGAGDKAECGGLCSGV